MTIADIIAAKPHFHDWTDRDYYLDRGAREGLIDPVKADNIRKMIERRPCTVDFVVDGEDLQIVGVEGDVLTGSLNMADRRIYEFFRDNEGIAYTLTYNGMPIYWLSAQGVEALTGGEYGKRVMAARDLVGIWLVGDGGEFI